MTINLLQTRNYISSSLIKALILILPKDFTSNHKGIQIRKLPEQLYSLFEKQTFILNLLKDCFEGQF